MWETGRRSKNQDSLAFWQMTKRGKCRILGVVCDGIGGLEEGENASAYVVRALVSWFVTKGHKASFGRKTGQALQQLFFQIHEEIREYGRRKKIRLGTTVTFVLSDGKHFLWGHAGDCRLYRMHYGRIRQLSADQQEADGSLNRGIGVGEWHLLQLGRGRLGKKDKLLLCSDGFYRGLERKELEHFLHGSIEEDSRAIRLLQQMAERKQTLGEQDNISALLLGRKGKEQ